MSQSQSNVFVKRLVCLANSRKHSGRCIAGKELGSSGDPGPWVRPVSDRPSEEVSEHERQFQDGSDPQILDIIDIPLKNPAPKTYQSENWLLDADHYWTRVDEAKWKDLEALADDPEQLWINSSSTYSGLRDRVSEPDAAGLHRSLYIVHVEDLTIRVFAPGSAFDNPKRKVQADFEHRGVRYKLWVTDPMIDRQYLAKADGDYQIGECFLTVSLGEPHKGYCYKLVAAVITPERAKKR